MQRIIKPGTKDYGIQRFACYSCECVFEADCADYSVEWRPHPYAGLRLISICPECGDQYVQIPLPEEAESEE